MPKLQSVKFLSLDKIEDQLVLVAFVCVLLSFFFGLQPEQIYYVLWASTGIVALFCIYFAFPYMWPYALMLYASYTISAFGVILIVFWYDAVDFQGISMPLLVGIFLILSAFYMMFYIVQHIKKARDASAKKGAYLPLGFWSISVMLFAAFSVLSILGWSIWARGGGLQFYLVLEPVMAFLLIYILWYPDRSLDWSVEHLPESPAAKFLVDKSKVLKKKVAKVRNLCPECGSKLKRERKACPSCNGVKTFGWCVKSEAYVLPCSHCGSMNLHGKEKCKECKKVLSDGILCNACEKAFPIKEWVAQT